MGQMSSDLTLESDSLARIADDAPRALACLRRSGAEDLIAVLGLSQHADAKR